MSELKITIVTAVYNGEKYIKEQLDSILSQLSDNDEVIISDDHSTDDTIKIIESYNDQRIKVFMNNKEKILEIVGSMRKGSAERAKDTKITISTQIHSLTQVCLKNSVRSAKKKMQFYVPHSTISV